MARFFDKVIVLSEIDRILLQLLEPNSDVSIAPNGGDTKAFMPYPLGGRREKHINHRLHGLCTKCACY